MKKTKVIVSFLMSCVLSLSCFGMTALAANTADTQFTFTSGTRYTDRRVKENATSVYVNYNAPGSNNLYIQAQGGVYVPSSNNYQWFNDTIGGTATCPANVKSVIKQYINERGRGVARLYCSSGDGTGLWSPDTAGSGYHAAN